MKRKKIEVIRIDENNRIYLYPKKVIYRIRKGGRWYTKFIGLTLSSVLESSVVDDEIKRKLAKILEKRNHFLNRGL